MAVVSNHTKPQNKSHRFIVLSPINTKPEVTQVIIVHKRNDTAREREEELRALSTRIESATPSSGNGKQNCLM